MIQTILVVCEGNICRSPMAKGLLSQRLPAVDVISAGCAAIAGHGADPMAIQLMAERGIDIKDHIAVTLNLEHLRMADLVLTMTRAQRKAIESRYPFAKGKVYCIGEYDGIDVADPHRCGRGAFELSLSQIDRCLTGWLGALQKIAY
ncbi:MAG TPA: low molecular weight protein-tyrosine-phosphatase [Trinickia sp.]|jgi:protein-tyrosine phosphatase|uniref:low molecular weight protein-tyrosine-phosphatase n=1 Tax=Trinickia sp. TaxID=2571163 RepID=UPI002C6F7363|nr:low molecular weight protein-tyrosine-phosphatase [Trinickia sp.]HTI18902.1 low molecular weight protein-tyrosine-phosphatase [Trinickia sp.]